MNLQGRYSILRKIADGGTAEIFLAKQSGAQGFEKSVVLKRIFPDFYNDPQFRHMLIDEALIAMSLNHSNIVQVLDLGEADGRYFLALELVDGWTLDKVLRRARAAGVPFPPALALYVTAEICRALAYAHAKTRDGNPLRIVHRDVSPHNVLVSEQGEVKLTDFGIAKAQNKRGTSLTGMIKGKIAFMSPEQAGGGDLDARSDLFSLGTLLYVMITGRFPFDAPTDYETLMAVKAGDFTPPEKIRPGLNPEVYRLIKHAMAKLPAARYQRAEDMLLDVERVMRVAFRAVGQTELKRWLADLSAKDGELPLTRLPAAPLTAEMPPVGGTSSPSAEDPRADSEVALEVETIEEETAAPTTPPPPPAVPAPNIPSLRRAGNGSGPTLPPPLPRPAVASARPVPAPAPPSPPPPAATASLAGDLSFQANAAGRNGTPAVGVAPSASQPATGSAPTPTPLVRSTRAPVEERRGVLAALARGVGALGAVVRPRTPAQRRRVLAVGAVVLVLVVVVFSVKAMRSGHRQEAPVATEAALAPPPAPHVEPAAPREAPTAPPSAAAIAPEKQEEAPSAAATPEAGTAQAAAPEAPAATAAAPGTGEVAADEDKTVAAAAPTDGEEAAPDGDDGGDGEAIPSAKGAQGKTSAKSVSVSIKSKPDGARVSTRHRTFGVTPLSLRLRPGYTYELTFVKAGYAPLSKQVRVSKSGTRSVRVSLKKAPEKKPAEPPKATTAPAPPAPKDKEWWKFTR